MSRYDDQHYGGREQVTGPRWGRVFGIILSIVLAIVLIGGVLVYYYGHNLISLTNYVSNQKQEVVKEEDLPQEARETVAAQDSIGTVVNESELQQIHKQMAEVVEKKEETVAVDNTDDVFNIVLAGVDRRDKSWNGNADSIMLLSINFSKLRASLISIMRDTYVDIPEVGYNKINNAYARGGGDLLCETISNNFNVDVDRYAAVDFENMIEIIDALGGIDLEWTDAEVEVANGYMLDMCNTLGISAEEHFLPGGGVYHCDGVQAVAYARNRFVGNSDYARTERQRYVLSQIMERVKSMNVAEMISFARAVLPLITHNVSEKDIWELIPKAPSILKFDFVKDRVPYDGQYDVIYVSGQDMLVPNWETTIQKMHDTMYGGGTASDNAENKLEDRTSGNQEFNQDWLDLLKKNETESDADGDASSTGFAGSVGAVVANAG